MATQNHSERRKVMFTLVVWQQLTVVYETWLMRYHVSLSRRLPGTSLTASFEDGSTSLCAHKLLCWNHLTRILSSLHHYFLSLLDSAGLRKIKGPFRACHVVIWNGYLSCEIVHSHPSPFVWNMYQRKTNEQAKMMLRWRCHGDS